MVIYCTVFVLPSIFNDLYKCLRMRSHLRTFTLPIPVALSLSMFINHCESLLCKIISKAHNEPRQPTDHQRPHKICEFNSAETVGGHWARSHGALPCIVM